MTLTFCILFYSETLSPGLRFSPQSTGEETRVQRGEETYSNLISTPSFLAPITPSSTAHKNQSLNNPLSF